MDKKKKFPIGSPISWFLFFSLRELYFDELKKGLSSETPRNKLHIYTPSGLTAFSTAGAIWEAIINERFTSDHVTTSRNNILFEIVEEVEKWDIKTKTLIFPKFLFGRTFDSSNVIFSDFTSIIQIRNNIAHYKFSMYEGPDKAIKDLKQKKITYPRPENIGTSWYLELCSTESIRFCINTISKLVKELENLETDISKEKYFPPIRAEIYECITETEVINEFKKFNINPNSIQNDLFNQI